MRTRSVVVLGALAALGAATPASAATLDTTRNCYQEGQSVVLRGSGFTPNARVIVRREDVAIGATTADAQGAIAGRFASRRITGGRREALLRLQADDGADIATTRYRVSKVFADFAPGRGNPATLRVRFRVNGFALRRRKPSVYVHYVRPNGRVRRSVRLARARGTCGRIDRTRLRRLFPFEAEAGRWILQFDTNARYRRATQRSRFVWVRKPVVVSRR